jgi:hypothetical protein
MGEFKMNVILRHVSQKLKYRALPNLVGTRITITNVASAPHEVADQLQEVLPTGFRFQGPEEKYIKITIAKYGILDLSFTVAGISWSSEDSAGIALLEEMGFVVRDSPKEDGPVADSDEANMLRALLTGIPASSECELK